MGPEGQVGAVVKRATPQSTDFPADEGDHARQHRPGCLVRKGGEEYPFRWDARFHQTGNPVGQCPRFSASCTGNNEERPSFFHNDPALLGIEFFSVVYHRPLTLIIMTNILPGWDGDAILLPSTRPQSDLVGGLEPTRTIGENAGPVKEIGAD